MSDANSIIIVLKFDDVHSSRLIEFGDAKQPVESNLFSKQNFSSARASPFSNLVVNYSNTNLISDGSSNNGFLWHFKLSVVFNFV